MSWWQRERDEALKEEDATPMPDPIAGDTARLFAVSRWLSDELDERVSLADQIPVCGAVLAAAALLLPPAERRRCLAAHLGAIQQLLRETQS